MKSFFKKIIVLLLICNITHAQQNANTIIWPPGKQVAISLTFDDARLSQVDVGTALLNQYNIKATFFVVPSGVENRLEGWKKAVADGHEIGNHSVNHPCTGNFLWSRKNALEDYTIEIMRKELTEANKRITELLNVTPRVFAYPCGQKFVGRGSNTKSYVPLISEMFILGRGWMDETPNDPAFCDFAQLSGIEMDGKDFEEILPLLNEAKKIGQWIVFAGHEMGKSGVQTTRLSMLKKLLKYASDPANGIWIAPVGTIATFIQDQRK